jgi:hypothetical protein
MNLCNALYASETGRVMDWVSTTASGQRGCLTVTTAIV